MSIEVLNIVLGSSCNRKCRYCIRAGGEREFVLRKSEPTRVVRRLQIEAESGRLKSLRRVQFFGGEPLLYFDRIKEIRNALLQMGVRPSQFWRVTTNGDLVDADYVTWANRSGDVRTVVSWHDGSISDESWSHIFKLWSVSVCALITHSNPTADWVRPRYSELVRRYKRELSFSVYPIHAAGHGGCESLAQDDVMTFVRWVEECSLRQDAFSRQIAGQALRMATEEPALGGAICSGDTVLTLDALGVEHLCPHNPTPDTDRKKGLVASARRECASCEAWSVCRGGCWLSENRVAECLFQKEFLKIGRKLSEATRHRATI